MHCVLGERLDFNLLAKVSANASRLKVDDMSQVFEAAERKRSPAIKQNGWVWEWFWQDGALLSSRAVSQCRSDAEQFDGKPHGPLFVS